MDLVAELKENVLKRQLSDERRYGDGRIVFLIRKAEIEEALNKGYSIKVVWQYLYEDEHFPIKYRAFADYVKRYIDNGNTLPKLGRPFNKRKSIDSMKSVLKTGVKSKTVL